jgi:hypothetical protein
MHPPQASFCRDGASEGITAKWVGSMRRKTENIVLKVFFLEALFYVSLLIFLFSPVMSALLK